jgi:putative transposase
MTRSSNPYRGFRYPAEVIEHAAWLYRYFSLSLREVELILAARGAAVTYESICSCGLRFGRMFANTLKRRRPQLGDKWHTDEVFIRNQGKLQGDLLNVYGPWFPGIQTCCLCGTLTKRLVYVFADGSTVQRNLYSTWSARVIEKDEIGAFLSCAPEFFA